jgi:hypothetical protein
MNPSNYHYVDSWPTLSGGRMLGHHIAYTSSQRSSDYGGVYGGVLSDYFVTSTGEVFEASPLSGLPGWRHATVYYVAQTGKRHADGIAIFDKARADKLSALIVGSYADLNTAIQRADAEWAKRRPAPSGTLAPPVAPKFEASSGADYIAQMEADAAARAKQTVDTATGGGKKKPGKKPGKKKKPIPTWAWIVGGGVLLVLLVGGGVFIAKRRRAAPQITGA